MEIKTLLKPILRRNPRKNARNETEIAIERLIQFTLKKHPNYSKKSPLNQHLRDFSKMNYAHKLEKLPWIYLHIEKDILDQSSSTSITSADLREQIKTNFSELLQLLSFNLIFLDSKVQEIILCRILINGVLERSLNILGHFKDPFLIEAHKELNKALDYINPDVDILSQRKRLLKISLDIFYKLKDSLGENAVLNIYHATYKKYFGNYYLLDSFTATLNIVPEDFLNQEMVDLPSKRQMHKMLQQQVSSLESINSKLTQEVVERKKTQAILQDSEQLKSTILETAMDGILLFDQNFIIRNCNEQAATILKLDDLDCSGMSILEVTSKKLRKLFKSFVESHLSNSQEVQKSERFEVKLNRNDDVYIEISIKRVKLSDEYVFNTFLRDITDQKQKEIEIREARKQAEKSAQAKAAFLSNMSHEIRTPLNIILGISSLLRKTEFKDLEQDKSNIESIHFSAENLLYLVNDVLDFSALDSGKIKLEHRKFDLVNLITNLKKGFSIKAQEKELTLDIVLDSHLPKNILGDQRRLAQILTNLLGNAIKFTDTGKILLDVHVENKENDTITIQFIVKDTGIGIEKKKLNDIFNSFYQVTNPGDVKKEGTGLGLFITKQLIELHGSSLDVSSISGLGSEFKFKIAFKIPKDDELLGFKNLKPYEADEFLEGTSILVAEDNKLNQLYIKQLLSKWKTKTLLVNNGQEAVDVAKANKFDIILMDLHMPVKDGYKATAEIRSFDLKTPIIACSADVFEESRIKANTAGVNAYITKPVREDEIKELLISYRLGLHKK